MDTVRLFQILTSHTTTDSFMCLESSLFEDDSFVEFFAQVKDSPEELLILLVVISKSGFSERTDSVNYFLTEAMKISPIEKQFFWRCTKSSTTSWGKTLNLSCML